jgi:hypothetical protein
MPNWFGLNWLDILLGIAILAIIPFLFAAYGGHLATESIGDPKRKRNIKFQFWLLFVIGVALASWQQIRGALNDREKPDIGLRLVYLDLPALILTNSSGAILRDPSYAPLIWDLENVVKQGVARPVPLRIPTAVLKDGFIRPHESTGPFALVSQVEKEVGPGDRLFGYIEVSCPTCVESRDYWVFAVRGKGGWYAEAKGRISLNSLEQRILEIEKNPDQFLKDIPESERVQIKEPN